jgi:hypothetical protein
MNGKSSKKDELEVSSAQLRAELIEIKERVGALETIASISNKDVVEKFVREHIATDKAPADSEGMRGAPNARTPDIKVYIC